MKKIVLSGIAFCLIIKTSAQVVYTELSSPFTVNATYAGEGYQIDFDNNATPELTVYANKVDTVLGGFLAATITGVAIYTMGNTGVAGSTQTLGTETLLVADSINGIQTINSSLNYVSSSTPAFFPAVGLTADAETTTGTFITSIGNYRNVGYKYVGVRFDISGNTHYGWIRVMCADQSIYGVIHSYAYETQPNTPIIAGDMGNGTFLNISNNSFDGDVYVAQNQLYINSQLPLVYEVYSVLGEKVMQSSVDGAAVVDISHLAAGVYIVNCSNQYGKYTLKFSKN